MNFFVIKLSATFCRCHSAIVTFATLTSSYLDSYVEVSAQIQELGYLCVLSFACFLLPKFKDFKVLTFLGEFACSQLIDWYLRYLEFVVLMCAVIAKHA